MAEERLIFGTRCDSRPSAELSPVPAGSASALSIMEIATITVSSGYVKSALFSGEKTNRKKTSQDDRPKSGC